MSLANLVHFNWDFGSFDWTKQIIKMSQIVHKIISTQIQTKNIDSLECESSFKLNQIQLSQAKPVHNLTHLNSYLPLPLNMNPKASKMKCQLCSGL